MSSLLNRLMKMANKWSFYCVFFILICFAGAGCRKQLSIHAPYSSITTAQVFADSADAESALAGIYSNQINKGSINQWAAGGATVYLGLSADELMSFSQGDAQLMQFYNNSLQVSNGYVYNIFWQGVYFTIYQANAIIEGLNKSEQINQSVKDEITGEAKFFRGLAYFYLANLFGDVPILTSVDYQKNQVASRVSKSDVYQQIVKDLTDALTVLPDDYSVGGGEKIRVNKWAATALLARVYLYQGKWSDAEAAATSIISSGQFSLTQDLNEVFLKNSSEAILQFQVNSSAPIANATPEGYRFVFNTPRPPLFYINPSLQSAFDSNDLRKSAWLDSTVYGGKTYYYPYKYKIGSGQMDPGGDVSEYYMVLRLSEQYLIRAEAKAQLNTDLVGAQSDLNEIRARAGLNALENLSQTQLLAAVAQERRFELFAEWGHRWLDLKRTEQADSVLSLIKPQWQSMQQLFPIPASELKYDPNLTQNQGYH